MFVDDIYHGSARQSAWNRRKISEELHLRLQSENKPLCETWYFVRLKTNHTHPVAGQLKQSNPELVLRIEGLIKPETKDIGKDYVIKQNYFGNYCRICSCQEEKERLISVFERDEILEKITVCLPITIHEGDELPQTVCEKCLSAVESSYNLIRKAQSSEKYFYSCINGEIKFEPANGEVRLFDCQPRILELDENVDCDLCGAYVGAEDLDKHIQENHVNLETPTVTDKPVHKICSLCGYLFDCDEEYNTHKREGGHRCLHCKKIMPSQCILNRHIKNACRPLCFCPYCCKTFLEGNSFLKHFQEKHCVEGDPKEKLKLECTKCDAVFEKINDLFFHYEKDHKMTKVWASRICGKYLSTKVCTKNNGMIYSQIKPFVCEWCGSFFRSKTNFIFHRASHTGIRQLKCHVCGKNFSRLNFLKTHLRMHTGERPYQCDKCGKRFSQMGHMRRHHKSHDQPISTREYRPVQSHHKRHNQSKCHDESKHHDKSKVYDHSTNVNESQPIVIIVNRDEPVSNIPVTTFSQTLVERSIENTAAK